MGLDVYLQRGGTHDEADSAVDTEHIFKRGYFRSSYNEGGINRVLSNAGCPDLYAIFQPPEGGGRFTPNWGDCLARAKSALDLYRAHLQTPAGRCHVSFEAVRDAKVQTTDRALAVFQEEMANPVPFDAWSNGKGAFWKEPARLRAAIPGNQWGRDGLYLIFERPPLAEGERDWYESALMIVVETLEYVLASDNANEFELYWSA